MSKEKYIENAAAFAFLNKAVISVDSDEWWYGDPSHRMLPEHRTKITGVLQEDQVISKQAAITINELFTFVSTHERETSKRKARPLFVDSTLLRLE